MYVCICKAVSDRTVAQAIASGARTVDAVGEVTGAGTDCGGCRRVIHRHLQRVASEPVESCGGGACGVKEEAHAGA